MTTATNGKRPKVGDVVTVTQGVLAGQDLEFERFTGAGRLRGRLVAAYKAYARGQAVVIDPGEWRFKAARGLTAAGRAAAAAEALRETGDKTHPRGTARLAAALQGGVTDEQRVDFLATLDYVGITNLAAVSTKMGVTVATDIRGQIDELIRRKGGAA